MVEAGAQRRSELAWAALVCALLLLASSAFVWAREGFLHKPRRVGSGDHAFYIEMAKGAEGDPARTADAPFCWRVLVPATAGALTRLGLGSNAAFYVLTNLSLFAFLLTLYLLLREFGFGHAPALLGVALGGLMQGAVRWYEYQYWMTDPAALFLIALCLLLIEREQTWSLVLAMIVAALVRETSVVVLPYYLVRLVRTRPPWEAARRTALLAAACLGALALLRFAIPALEPDGLGSVVREVLAQRRQQFWESQLYLLTLGSWGVLVPLALLSPASTWSALRRRPEALALLLGVYASLIAANNTERLLAYALPAVLPLALGSLRDFAAAARVPWSALALAALALQGYFLASTRLFEPGASQYQPNHWGVVGAMAAFWIGCQALRAARSRPTAASA